MNSLWNKFENLCELVADNADVLCIAEIKMDPILPILQFSISGFISL